MKIAAILLENNQILIAHSRGATRSTTSVAGLPEINEREDK